jgi:spermidine synthase
MYSTVAGHLAAGGLFCQWLPLYQLTRSEFDLIARTFLDVFPHVSLWRSDFYADRPVVGLVGQMQEGRIDLAAASQRASRLPDWGSDPMIASERGLAMFYVGDLAGGRAMVSGATINTDDRPLIEFLAPRLTSVGADGDKQWFIGDPLADFYDGLAKSSSKDAGAILPPSDELVTSQQAGTLLYRYALAATRKDTAAAAGFEEQVRRMVPEVIAGVEASRGAASPDPDDELAKLHEDRVEVRKEIEALERRVSELGRSPEGNQK